MCFCVFESNQYIYIYRCCNVLDAMSTSICSLNMCSNSATMNAPKTLLGAKGPPRTYRTDCTTQDATMFPPANEFHSGSRWKVVSLEAKTRKWQSNAGIKERENRCWLVKNNWKERTNTSGTTTCLRKGLQGYVLVLAMF